jgi:hypothetical protein
VRGASGSCWSPAIEPTRCIGATRCARFSLTMSGVRRPAVERVELRRFTRAQLDAQLGSILGRPPEPALVDPLYRRSEGNPLFTEELLAASGEGIALPPSLRAPLLLRIEALPPSAQGALRLAAAHGALVTHRLLAAALAAGRHGFPEAHLRAHRPPFYRRILGNPKCGKTLLSPNQVIADIRSLSSVRTSIACGRAMSVWGWGSRRRMLVGCWRGSARVAASRAGECGRGGTRRSAHGRPPAYQTVRGPL